MSQRGQPKSKGIWRGFVMGREREGRRMKSHKITTSGVQFHHLQSLQKISEYILKIPVDCSLDLIIDSCTKKVCF